MSRFALAILISAILISGCASAGIKLQVGKSYDAVYGCAKQVVITDEGAVGVDVCYAELWTVLRDHQNGWYYIHDVKSGGQWMANIKRLAAIREHVEKPEPTPVVVDPGPRIQAGL